MTCFDQEGPGIACLRSYAVFSGTLCSLIAACSIHEPLHTPKFCCRLHRLKGTLRRCNVRLS